MSRQVVRDMKRAGAASRSGDSGLRDLLLEATQAVLRTTAPNPTNTSH